jgi:hypothetical protein
VRSQTQSRLLGLIGEPRVNVLKLNLALDARQSGMKSGPKEPKIPPG